MLGRELKLPIDLLLTRPEEQHCATTYGQTLQEGLEHIHFFIGSVCRLQLIG